MKTLKKEEKKKKRVGGANNERDACLSNEFSGLIYPPFFLFIIFGQKYLITRRVE